MVPRQEGADGKLYMVLGKLVISGSTKGVQQVGDETLVNAWMFTSGGGATMPLGFLVKPSADRAAISGEVFFGRELTPENLATLRGQGRAITGESVAAKATRQESSAW